MIELFCDLEALHPTIHQETGVTVRYRIYASVKGEDIVIDRVTLSTIVVQDYGQTDYIEQEYGHLLFQNSAPFNSAQPLQWMADGDAGRFFAMCRAAVRESMRGGTHGIPKGSAPKPKTTPPPSNVK